MRVARRGTSEAVTRVTGVRGERADVWERCVWTEFLSMKIIGRFGDIYGGIDAGDWTTVKGLYCRYVSE